MQSQMLKDIEARFSSDLITDQYENYYRKMLEQGENKCVMKYLNKQNLF